MLTELCAYLKNYFLVDYLHPEERIHYGTYTIEQGHFVESLSFLSEGQYFRIVGSLFNDGVYCLGKDELMDETFTGSIWAMSVPPEVSALANDISAWIAANSKSLSSPYQSESFGGYSYSKSSGGGTSNPSAAYSWQDQFASRLAPYRRLSVL